jgi:hypothetical protein
MTLSLPKNEVGVDIEYTSGKKTAHLRDYRSNVFVFPHTDKETYHVLIMITNKKSRNRLDFEFEPKTFEPEPTLLCLPLVSSFSEYLRWLNALKEKLTIIVASKDAHTPWDAGLRAGWLTELCVLGCRDISEMFRAGYLCIIDAGNVAVEEISPDGRATASYTVDPGLGTEVLSEGFNYKNSPKCTASVLMGGRNYAVNERGLNFVIIDRESGTCVDSVCFDTFLRSRACSRKD